MSSSQKNPFPVEIPVLSRAEKKQLAERVKVAAKARDEANLEYMAKTNARKSQSYLRSSY